MAPAAKELIDLRFGVGHREGNLVDVVSAIQTSIEIVKKLRELSKKVADADFKMLLADLSSELGDAKLEAANLKVELAEAREKLLDAQSKVAAREAAAPAIVEGVYSFAHDPDGRYCTGCFDTKKMKVRLAVLAGYDLAFGKWACPSCKVMYSPS